MLAGVGSLILLAGSQITLQTFQRQANDLQLQSQLIANAIREPIERSDDNHATNARSVTDLTNSFAQSINARITIVDEHLSVLASSDSRVRTRTESNRAEFMAASRGTTQYDVRWDDSSNEQRLFVASPVLGEHAALVGFVQVSVPTTIIYATIISTWLVLIGIGAIVLVATVLASILLARQIAVPVQHLTTTSERIAAGHLDERVSPSDPDEIRRLGVAFNSMADRVQEMVEQQREFVDNAAHEFRSPLTSLRLRIEMLQTHGGKNPDLSQRYLGQMSREIGFLQRLVDHLLALASVEGGESAPRTSLDLAPMLYEIADSIELVVRDAGMTFQMHVPDHLPNMLANDEQMNVVVRNLIDNAIKYTARGGTITLAAQSAGKEIQISVSDTGMGIPADALPHIFDRFYRVDRARSREQGGAGIGLSLVRAIVESYGGRIEAESKLNEGSKFTVWLPVS
jgi:signal transduction histidine kinase